MRLGTKFKWYEMDGLQIDIDTLAWTDEIGLFLNYRNMGKTYARGYYPKLVI